MAKNRNAAVQVIESPVREVQFTDETIEHVAQVAEENGDNVIKNDDGSVKEIEHKEPAEEQEAPIDLKIEATMMALGEKALIEIYGNKSNAIRGLSVLGHKNGPISRALNIRFQHVRNVLLKPLKRVIAEERKAAAASQPKAE
jgi:hypothetical protein